MFDFEKLLIYQKAKLFRKEINLICENAQADRVINNQLRRAALSIPLNIAEGTSRYSKADRRNFYVIARGSVTECIAALDMLHDDGLISNSTFRTRYTQGEELSKMLYAMIQKLS
jgi:four helix bundle protein